MAVKFKPSPKAFVSKLIGADNAEMFFADWAVMYVEPTLTFKSKKSLKKFQMTVPLEDMKTIAWTFLLSKHMEASKIAAYKQTLNEIAEFGGKPSVTTMPPVSEKLAELSAELKAEMQKGGSATAGAPECTAEEMATMPLVPLLTANRLLQPVKGTSADVRYYYIAQYKNGVRLAVKYKGGGFAIRMEGQKINEMKARWTKVGLGWEENKPYQSAHMSMESANDALKVIGSLLFGISTEIVTPFPTLEKLVK